MKSPLKFAHDYNLKKLPSEVKISKKRAEKLVAEYVKFFPILKKKEGKTK